MNLYEDKMTKQARVLKRKKCESTLAEQFAALDKLRELVRQIEADRADRNADPKQRVGRKNKLASYAAA